MAATHRGASWQGPTGALASAAFLVAGVAAALLYSAQVADVVDVVAFTVVGAGSCLAVLLGPILHRARPRLPWVLLAVAAGLLLVGAVLRPWAEDQHGAAVAAADVFSVPGYLLGLSALILLLRARGSLERHAVADGLIVCLGAGLLSLLLFALPAAAFAGRPAWQSTLAALYPVFDVMLLLVLVNLAFTTAVRCRSFELLVAAIAAMLVGDIGYAAIGAAGRLTGSWLLDLPFLLAYTLLGAAALHPSMVELGRALPRPVQAWSWRRLAVLLPALATPFGVVALVPEPTPALRAAVSATGAAMIAALLLRAVSAVHGYARAQGVFRHQATHDALTGLPNRVLLTEQVTALLAVRRPDWAPVWLLFLDLDGFKLVNDSWGHDTGDRLIVAVGRRLRAAVADSAVVARVGGDEFVVVAPLAREEAVALAEQIIVALSTPFDVDGAELFVTASIGMARATGGGTATAETLLRDADTAMYRAKNDGRSRWVVFDASMRQRVRERVDIELALRHAISRGQLAVAYQPVVDLASGSRLGAEALVRWAHPIRGPMAPADFIPVAEESGLVGQVGEWVLGEATRQLAAWRADGTVAEGFSMAVNVSTRQLRDGRFRDSVAAALRHHELPPSRLVLEITESVMLDPSDGARQILLGLRELGVQLSVDDFGTGYSALGYLRRYPVTGVKIDREFVAGLGRDGDDEEIVRAIAAMSTALGLTVVAEGVETRAQCDVLRSVGVTQGQGWLFGPALRPGSFARGGAAAPAAGAVKVHLPVGNSYAQ
jgi:diguanylate cyclase